MLYTNFINIINSKLERFQNYKKIEVIWFKIRNHGPNYVCFDDKVGLNVIFIRHINKF